jgi:hypothetical protein
MTKRRTHPGGTGDSQQLALAVGRGGLKAWLAALERRVAGFEAVVEHVPISQRRGRWLEKRLPLLEADTRVMFAAARRKFPVALMMGGGKLRLREIEARQMAAFARLAARVSEERAKGWPLKTLYAERLEL